MSLRARLSRLQTQAGSGFSSPETIPASPDLRSRLARVRTQRLHTQAVNNSLAISDEALAQQLQGTQVAEGVIQICKRFPLRGTLGKTALASLPAKPCLPGESECENLRCVYIDTETTGLSGGSGTLAFLIGMAVIEQGAIELSQFLLTRFSAEETLLSAFAEAISAEDRLISYNGKSYDLPLLLTRYRMQALSHPFVGLPHLDLLHPTRRLFGKRWHDCRLITLEENLLGFRRVDDLPGAEAPAAWFSYIRQGLAHQLVKVVAHNQQDIFSLVVAHSALTQAIEQPRGFGVDLHALARWIAETDEASALELLVSHAQSLCDDAKRLLGHLSRRAENWPLALGIWERLAARGCMHSIEHLAKYHEHVSKDYSLAQRYCLLLPGGDAQAHRLNRLHKKLYKVETESITQLPGFC